MNNSAFKGINASNFDVIFDHADTNNDGVLTKIELELLLV